MVKVFLLFSFCCCMKAAPCQGVPGAVSQLHPASMGPWAQQTTQTQQRVTLPRLPPPQQQHPRQQRGLSSSRRSRRSRQLQRPLNQSSRRRQHLQNVAGAGPRHAPTPQRHQVVLQRRAPSPHRRQAASKLLRTTSRPPSQLPLHPQQGLARRAHAPGLARPWLARLSCCALRCQQRPLTRRLQGSQSPPSPPRALQQEPRRALLPQAAARLQAAVCQLLLPQEAIAAGWAQELPRSPQAGQQAVASRGSAARPRHCQQLQLAAAAQLPARAPRGARRPLPRQRLRQLLAPRLVLTPRLWLASQPG